MSDHNKFMTIIEMNSSLIEESDDVNHDDVFAIRYQLNYIRLQEEWINVQLSDRIQFSNVDDYTILFFVVNYFSNIEYEIAKRSETLYLA